MENKRVITVRKRQNRILELLKEGNLKTIKDFADYLHVSEMTIRRDLSEMSLQGLITVSSGTICVNESSDLADQNLDVEIIRARKAIAEYAAQFVEEGDILFLNASSTALQMLDYVPEKNVRVYTNNGNAAFRNLPDGVIINLIGGEVFERVMIGDYVMEHLLSMEADKSFIGCASLFTDGELRYDIPTEIGINESMISRTRVATYVLADHSKIRSRTRNDYEIKYGSIRYEQGLTLITDDGIDEKNVRLLRDAGMEVIVVPVQ